MYFGVLPLFALTNADVSFAGMDMGSLFASPVFFGIFFGLLVGKPLGIMLMSFLVVKLKLASLPENVNWQHMLGASILGGVGFTMAIFVANLAFTDAVLVATAKLGILLASLAAGVLGFTFLLVQARGVQKQGVAFVDPAAESADEELEALPTAAREAALEGREMLYDLEADEELDPRGVA